ncbi:MAG: hypothetical protein PQJ46_14665 [Spirochaetales bacterium]|nr:hypothetical protein [Spirochaetales bacterium]
MSEESRENSEDQKKKRDGRKNRYHRGNRRYQKKDYPVCPYCGNSVKDINTAIASEEDESPAHFDCVLKQLEKRETLEKDEKICYLGRGSFGIVKTRNGGSMKFFIRKRIQYEKEEKKFDWRKTISKRIRK